MGMLILVGINTIFFTLIIILPNIINGFDLASFPGRLDCYPNQQPNCNVDFIDAYPNLSRSATNLTKAETWFLLFTRRNRDRPEKLHKCAGRLPPNSNFNPNKQLVVLIMQFNIGFCDVAVYREWVIQFLEREDCNVLVVDYTWGSRIDYGGTIINSKVVAKQTVIVLKNIQNDTGITGEKIYLVGHSVGAHIAGIVGSQVVVRRITGIDPAGPGYAEKTPLAERLDAGDADFVDVWHCGGGDCLPYLGINYDAGDVDYYINGGHFQFPCFSTAVEAYATGDFVNAIGSSVLTTLCSHLQCTRYFMLSINPKNCEYVGCECDNVDCDNAALKSNACKSCGENPEMCAIMGVNFEKYYNKSNSHRRYYVPTTTNCDFCDRRLYEEYKN